MDRVRGVVIVGVVDMVGVVDGVRWMHHVWKSSQR